MSGEICIIRNCLLGSQISQLIRSRSVVRERFPIISILQNDAQSIRRIHQNLNNPRLQVREPARPTRFPSYVQIHRTASLIVRRVEIISLGEGRVRVRGITGVIWEMVDGGLDCVGWVPRCILSTLKQGFHMFGSEWMSWRYCTKSQG